MKLNIPKLQRKILHIHICSKTVFVFIFWFVFVKFRGAGLVSYTAAGQ